MSFTVAKQEYVGTKLDGPALAAGIQPVTITSIKDLGMVKVSPQFPRQDGKTEVHQAEFIFTGANGAQGKKDATVSLHEKSFIYKVIVAVTGAPPSDSFDLDSLVGKNLIVLTETKTSKKGKSYAKITGVAPASAGQPSFTAPTKPVASNAPATQNVGW